MAGNNGKPKKQSAPKKMRFERQLKVSSMLTQRENKEARWPGAGKIEMKVPWIRMQGKWLEEAGFEIHKPVRIRVMMGCLVLVIDRRNGATNVRRNGATNRCVKRHLEGVKQ